MILFNNYHCPDCNVKLTILDKKLMCERCRAYYEIENNIPNFLSRDKPWVIGSTKIVSLFNYLTKESNLNINLIKRKAELFFSEEDCIFCNM